MAVLITLFFVGLVVSIALGYVAYRATWALPGGGPSAWGRAAAARFGAIPSALGILVLGTAAVTVVCLPVGFLAKALQSSVDDPTFRWVQQQVYADKFTSMMNKLTTIGNTGNVELVCMFAIVVLAAIWRRNFWVPPVAIFALFFAERWSQKGLTKIVARDHVPTTKGNFPSGGVGRILCVYGLILVFVIMVLPPLTRAWRIALWAGLGTTAYIEAYSRVFLSKHWLTDAVAGIIFGYLLLIVSAAVAAALAYSYGPHGRPATDAEAQEPQAPKRPYAAAH